MHLCAKLSSAQDILPLRARFRQEMNCQIVHDSIHRRQGWTLSYLLELGGAAVGFRLGGNRRTVEGQADGVRVLLVAGVSFQGF
jgi:hypothetical protein